MNGPRIQPRLSPTGIKGGKHETIRHKDKIYVRGDVHTNTVESAFSLFKRGLMGAFHKVSLKFERPTGCRLTSSLPSSRMFLGGLQSYICCGHSAFPCCTLFDIGAYPSLQRCQI